MRSTRKLDPAAGTYALLLECREPGTSLIGRLGPIEFARGVYVYIGSAFGPGGIAARVGRHFGQIKARRWHIDYARDVMQPVGVLIAYNPQRMEHEWAGALNRHERLCPVGGFGSSDCRCATHLFGLSGSCLDPAELAEVLSPGQAGKIAYGKPGAAGMAGFGGVSWD